MKKPGEHKGIYSWWQKEVYEFNQEFASPMSGWETKAHVIDTNDNNLYLLTTKDIERVKKL